MKFKVNSKFIFEGKEFLVTSVNEEYVYYHDNFEKRKELVYRVRTDAYDVGFIVFKNSDRIVLTKSSEIYLTNLEIDKVKSIKVLDSFKFNSHNFILKNILDVDALDLGIGKSYVFVSKVNDILKFSLNVTFYSNSDIINSFLLEIRELDISNFTF